GHAAGEPAPQRRPLERGRRGDAPRTWTAPWPPPPLLSSALRRARRSRSRQPDPRDPSSLGVPELLTHGVPETMERQTARPAEEALIRTTDGASGRCRLSEILPTSAITSAIRRDRCAAA